MHKAAKISLESTYKSENFHVESTVEMAALEGTLWVDPQAEGGNPEASLCIFCRIGDHTWNMIAIGAYGGEGRIHGNRWSDIGQCDDLSQELNELYGQFLPFKGTVTIES